MVIIKGSQVKLVQPIIQGEVLETRYNNDAESLERLVQYADVDGELQQRWFLDGQLEEVPAQE